MKMLNGLVRWVLGVIFFVIGFFGGGILFMLALLFVVFLPITIVAGGESVRFYSQSDWLLLPMFLGGISTLFLMKKVGNYLNIFYRIRTNTLELYQLFIAEDS